MPFGRNLKAGKAIIELSLISKDVEKQLRSVQANVARVGAGFASAARGALAISAAIVGPLTAAANTFRVVGDAIHKMSARTGISTNLLSELGFAAEQSGATLEDVERGITGMARFLLQAERGLTSATDILKILNLSMHELENQTPEKRMRRLLKAVGEIEDPTRRAGVAMVVFGRAGQQLLPMINNFQELSKQAKEFGLSIGPQAANQAAALQDAFNLMNRSIRGVSFSVGQALGPALTETFTKVADLAAQFGQWISNNQQLVVTVGKVGLALAGIAAPLAAIATVAKVSAFVIAGLGTALNGLAIAMTGVSIILNPLLIALAALAGAGFVGYKFFSKPLSMPTDSRPQSMTDMLQRLERHNAALSSQQSPAAQAKVDFDRGQELTVLERMDRKLADLVRNSQAGIPVV